MSPPTGPPLAADGYVAGTESDRATHSAEWYRPLLEAGQVRLGDQMLIRCEGGPSISRLESFPPALEVSEPGGVYVLDDNGPVYSWHYVFVAGEI